MPRQSTKEMIYSPAIIHINLFAPISLGHVSATSAPNVFRVRSFVKANGHAPVGKKKKNWQHSPLFIFQDFCPELAVF